MHASQAYVGTVMRAAVTPLASIFGSGFPTGVGNLAALGWRPPD